MTSHQASPGSAFARSAALVAGAKVLGGASLVVLNVWIAQRVTPDTYGVFAIAATGLLLFDGVIGSALDAAVIARISRVPGADLTAAEGAGMLLKLGAGAAVAVVLTILAAAVAGPSAASMAAVVGVGATGLLVHRSLLVYLQLRERFAWYAVIDLVQTAARWIAVTVLLGAVDRTGLAIVAGYALVSWITAAAALVPFVRIRRTWEKSASAFAEVRGAAWTTLATTSVGAVTARLDVLVLGAVAGAAEAGILAAAATIALTPMWLGAYLAPAFTGRILPYCRERRLWPLFVQVQWPLVILAVVGTGIGTIAGPALIEGLLPASYLPSASVVPVLLVAGAAGFVTFPLVLHTLLFLSPRTYLLMDLISLPVVIPLYVVAARRAGASGVAWVTAVSAITKACIAHVAAAAAVQREEARVSGMALSSVGLVR